MHCNRIFLTSFERPSQDILMKKSSIYDVHLKIITKIKKEKRIEQVMNESDKKRTGLTKLSPKELVNLNSWLDKNGVVAPGPIDHGPH